MNSYCCYQIKCIASELGIAWYLTQAIINTLLRVMSSNMYVLIYDLSFACNNKMIIILLLSLFSFMACVTMCAFHCS